MTVDLEVLVSELYSLAAFKDGRALFLMSHALRSGWDVNSRGPGGKTLLRVACENGRADLVSNLIEAGANRFETVDYCTCSPERRDNDDVRPAYIQGDAGIMFLPVLKARTWCWSLRKGLDQSSLLQEGLWVNSADEQGRTALMRACKVNDRMLFDKLIQAGADVNQRDLRGETVIFAACKGINRDLMEAAVENGADPSVLSRSGKSLFWVACRTGNTGILDYVLSLAPFDLAAVNSQGQSAIFAACSNGNSKMFSKLVSLGLDANSVDKAGATPFLIACKRGNRNIFKKLVKELGADVFRVDNEGNSAFHYAAQGRATETIKWLKQLGLDKNKVNKAGMTPLDLALKSDSAGHVHHVAGSLAKLK